MVIGKRTLIIGVRFGDVIVFIPGEESVHETCSVCISLPIFHQIDESVHFAYSNSGTFLHQLSDQQSSGDNSDVRKQSLASSTHTECRIRHDMSVIGKR